MQMKQSLLLVLRRHFLLLLVALLVVALLVPSLSSSPLFIIVNAQSDIPAKIITRNTVCNTTNPNLVIHINETWILQNTENRIVFILVRDNCLSVEVTNEENVQINSFTISPYGNSAGRYARLRNTFVSYSVTLRKIFIDGFLELFLGHTWCPISSSSSSPCTGFLLQQVWRVKRLYITSEVGAPGVGLVAGNATGGGLVNLHVLDSEFWFYHSVLSKQRPQKKYLFYVRFPKTRSDTLSNSDTSNPFSGESNMFGDLIFERNKIITKEASPAGSEIADAGLISFDTSYARRFSFSSNVLQFVNAVCLPLQIKLYNQPTLLRTTDDKYFDSHLLQIRQKDEALLQQHGLSKEFAFAEFVLIDNNTLDLTLSSTSTACEMTDGALAFLGRGYLSPILNLTRNKVTIRSVGEVNAVSIASAEALQGTTQGIPAAGPLQLNVNNNTVDLDVRGGLGLVVKIYSPRVKINFNNVTAVFRSSPYDARRALQPFAGITVSTLASMWFQDNLPSGILNFCSDASCSGSSTSSSVVLLLPVINYDFIGNTVEVKNVGKDAFGNSAGAQNLAGIACLVAQMFVDSSSPSSSSSSPSYVPYNRFRFFYPKVRGIGNKIRVVSESENLNQVHGFTGLGEFTAPGVAAAVPGSIVLEDNDIVVTVNSPRMSSSASSSSSNAVGIYFAAGLSSSAMNTFSLLLITVAKDQYKSFGGDKTTFFTAYAEQGKVSAKIVNNKVRVNCLRSGIPCNVYRSKSFKSVSVSSALFQRNSFLLLDSRSDSSTSCNPQIIKSLKAGENSGMILLFTSTSYLTPTNGVSEKKADFVFDETNTFIFNTTPSTCNEVIGGASKMAIFSFVSFNPENAAVEIPLHLKISLDKVSTQVQLQPGLKMNSLFRLPTSQTKTLLLDFSVLDTSLNVRGVKEPITDSPALLGMLPSSLASGSVIDLSTVSLEGDLSVSTPDFKRALHHCPSILSFDKTGNSPQLQSAPTCSGGAGTNKCDFKIRCLLDRCVPQASSLTNLQQLMLQTGFESAAFETASWNVETNNTDCFNPTRTLTPQQSRTSKTRTISKYVTAPVEPVEKVSENFVDSTNGLQGTNLAISATVSAVVPTLSFGVARQQATMDFVTAAKSGSCRGIDESNFKPAAADSPTQMQVGSSIARYYIGGAVGNGVLTFSLILGGELLGVLYMKRTGSSSWNKPYKVFARCHVALVAFVFFSLLLAPTLTLGLVAVAQPKSIVSVPSKFLTILFCLLFLAAALYQTIWALYIRDRVEKYKLTKLSRREQEEESKLKKFISYWFEGPGEWVMPNRAPDSLQRELNAKDHLDFDAANPVFDGYNNRAPWFAVAEYAVQIGLALASFLAQVVPEKVSCVTQAVVLCVTLCAYLFLCLWLRPFQEKFNIIVMPVMTTIQLVIIVIVAAMGAEQPSWIESLAVFSASMQSAVAIVVLLASFGPLTKPLLKVWQNLKRRTRGGGGGEGRREGTARSNENRQFHARTALGSSLGSLLRDSEGGENAEDEIEMQMSLRRQRRRQEEEQQQQPQQQGRSGGGRENQQQQQQQGRHQQQRQEDQRRQQVSHSSPYSSLNSPPRRHQHTNHNINNNNNTTNTSTSNNNNSEQFQIQHHHRRRFQSAAEQSPQEYELNQEQRRQPHHQEQEQASHQSPTRHRQEHHQNSRHQQPSQHLRPSSSSSNLRRRY